MAQSNHGTLTRDVVDILTSDHQEMVELLGQAERTSDASQRRDIAETVIAEVMRHAVAEEMFVYPAIKSHVPNGAEQVEQDKQEHDEIVQTMKQMEDLDASGPAFIERVRQLVAQLRHHAEEEESKQFPQLRAHISSEKLAELGDKVQKAKKVAPTRPHPGAPHSELFHKSVGPGVGMIDRLRDELTRRQTG